jgi:phenylacetate-CoA ligase
MDTMSVEVEVSESLFSDDIKELEQLTKRITRDIKDILGVTCQVRLVNPRSIQRSEGKAQRVIDKRQI